VDGGPPANLRLAADSLGAEPFGATGTNTLAATVEGGALPGPVGSFRPPDGPPGAGSAGLDAPPLPARY